jgi:hypothetical protein
MKKLLLIFSGLMLLQSFKSKAQCEYYVLDQTGSMVTFEHLWPLVIIYNLDSVRFNYGDATTQLIINPIPSTSNHVYPSLGTFVTCLTRYTSSINNPGIAISCTYCDTIELGSLGINNITKPQLDIYPNPTTNSVWVNLPADVATSKLQIVDVAGRTLSEINVSKTQLSKVEIKLNTFSNGLYFIKLTTQQGIYSSPIIKQ